jgi:ABC-type branched-subunit amino acid transport system substrate-binding protein
LHNTKVSDTLGKFYKMQGVTTVGAVGYSISPLSSESAKASIESAKSQGLKSGYLNSNFPFGSTDVQPVALAMKSAGVNGMTATTDPNTGFALVTALRQAGANVKVAIFATGYGGDLLQAGPGALNAAQNVYFSLGYEPVEMNTPATKQFVADLKSAGITGSPTYAEYNGYLSVGLLVRALKANGGNTSSSAVIGALSNIHDWDALGLFGSHKLDINDRDNIVAGADNCLWITKLEGNQFKLVKGATPICGNVLPGVTVSASS